MTLNIPKNAYFDPTDGCYHCVCGQLLRYNAGTKTVIAVNSCDSSVESVSSYDAHVCSANNESQKRPAANHLQAQQNEIDLQKELYGKFESSAQFGTDREQKLKQKQLQGRKPLTEEHKKHIADSIHTTLQNKRELSFLAQNKKQLEEKEIER